MKVLILHQHFKLPQRGGAIRSYYLARALVERGVETVVITAHNEPVYSRESVEGIDIHYVPVPYDNRFGFNKRVLAFFRFVAKSVRLSSLHRDASLCYAISTPLTTGLAAMIIRKRFGIPYVFEVGDLWPDAPIKMGFIRNAFLIKALHRMERSIYRTSSSIVALSGAIAAAVKNKVPEKNVHVLPNFADTDFFRPSEKDAAAEVKFGVTGKFVISYIGAIGVANGLRYFLECAQESDREGLAIHFIICGDGARVDELRQFANSLSLNNLTFLAFRNREGVAEVMNITDANFICYQTVKILETGSPNKYFDGLAAGKLTVINFGGWIREEIEKEHCGIYVDPEEPRDFVGKIVPFVTDRGLLAAHQHAGRALAESKYARSLLSDVFYRLIKDHAMEAPSEEEPEKSAAPRNRSAAQKQ